ncbi:MAG: class I SAM-dependent methyltransferase [Bacteroidota bacterium]
MRNFLRKLFYALPTNLRFFARRLFYLPVDTYEYLTHQRRPPYPPKGLIYTGSGDFKDQGEKLLQDFIQYGQLRPSDKVLDIGSGIGRLAIPLAKYLDQKGSYEGFDVIEYGVQWCQKYITSEYPNFNFTHIPLHNDLYTKEGQNATTFQFPYPKATFDKAILLSVFTHMLPAEVANYIAEIKRVLKKGGLCYATFFIINEESQRMMADQFTFPFEYDHHFLMDQKVQSANVAYKEFYLKELFKSEGLSIVNIHYGWWCGRDKAHCVQFQDVIIIEQVP